MKPPTNSMIECYVEKVVYAILKDEIDKNEIMDKFMLKFENISRTWAVMKNEKLLVVWSAKKWSMIILL